MRSIDPDLRENRRRAWLCLKHIKAVRAGRIDGIECSALAQIYELSRKVHPESFPEPFRSTIEKARNAALGHVYGVKRFGRPPKGNNNA